MENPMIAIAAVGALGGLCQWLAWKFKLPSILFLLTAGILVGPIFGVFDPDEFLGDLLFPIVSIFVAIILFEGGLTLKFKDIRGHGRVVRRLISVGVILTWILIAVAVHYLFDMPWSLAAVSIDHRGQWSNRRKAFAACCSPVRQSGSYPPLGRHPH